MDILKKIEHTNVEPAKQISQEKNFIPTQPMSLKTIKEQNDKENYKPTFQNKSQFSIIKIKEEKHDTKISKFSCQERTQHYISKKTENKNEINTTKPSQEKNQSISPRQKEDKNNTSITENIQIVTPKTKADDLLFLKKLKSPETTDQSYITPILSKRSKLPFFIRHMKNKEDNKIAEVLVYKLGSQSTPRKIRKNKHFNTSPRKNWGTPESDFYFRARSLKNKVAKGAINKRVIRKKKIEITPVPFVKPGKTQHSCNNKYNEDSNHPKEQTNSRNILEQSFKLQSVKSLINRFEQLSNGTDSNTSKIKNFAFKRVPRNKENISSKPGILATKQTMEENISSKPVILDTTQTMEITIKSKSNTFNQNSIFYNTSQTIKPEVAEETLNIRINENYCSHNNNSTKVSMFTLDTDLTQRNGDVKNFDPVILSTNNDNPIDTKDEVNKQQGTVPDVYKSDYLEEPNINEGENNDHKILVNENNCDTLFKSSLRGLIADSNNVSVSISSDIDSTQRDVEVKITDPMVLSTNNNDISIDSETQINKKQESVLHVDKRDYLEEPNINEGKYDEEGQQLDKTEENEDLEYENVLSLFSIPKIKNSTNGYSLESEKDKNDNLTSHGKTNVKNFKYFIKVLAEENYDEFSFSNCDSMTENSSATDHSSQNDDNITVSGTGISENLQFDGLKNENFSSLVSPDTINDNITVCSIGTSENLQFGGLKDEDFPPLISPEKNTVFID